LRPFSPPPLSLALGEDAASMYLYQLLEKVVPPLACSALVALPVGMAVLIRREVTQQMRRRKARFADRESMPRAEWFARYFPNLTSNRPALIELLHELEKELEVDRTRLRPEDTFSGKFAFHGSFLGECDELDGFWCAERDWVNKQRIDLGAVPEGPADTLADYLARAHALLEARSAGNQL
jgi:hypothetical protein